MAKPEFQLNVDRRLLLVSAVAPTSGEHRADWDAC